MRRGLLLLALTLVLHASPSFADPADPLHGFCWGATPACTDNGTNTPTSTNPPNFGFTVSPGPQTGDFLIDVLVPNNEAPTPGALSFAVTGTQGGPANNLPLAGTATLFSATAWTSGQLDTYLGISADPANPIGAYLPSTQILDPGATGFFVYQVDLGTNQLQDNPNPLLGPLLSISSGLPLASYIVGFLNVGAAAPNWIATANSGAIFETGRRVPEPSTILLLGLGLTGVGYWSRKRKG
jgi:hypothetical protein